MQAKQTAKFYKQFISDYQPTKIIIESSPYIRSL